MTYQVPPMYARGEEIEYSNGLIARVMYAQEDGHFVIQQPEGYAACWRDLRITDEEVWCFVNEAEAFRPSLDAALADIPAAPLPILDPLDVAFDPESVQIVVRAADGDESKVQTERCTLADFLSSNVDVLDRPTQRDICTTLARGAAFTLSGDGGDWPCDIVVERTA